MARRPSGWRRVVVGTGAVLAGCASTPASVPTRTAPVPSTSSTTVAPVLRTSSSLSAATTAASTVAPATTSTSTPPPTFVPTGRRGPAGDAFYRPPVPLPLASPGSVIWSSPLDASPPGSTGYRVLYHSTSITGADIAVSGLVWVPARLSPRAPLLSYAHAPSGLGDDCAPSKSGANGEAAELAAPFLAEGYIVVATDYEGLGTQGGHPFGVGASEAHAVLDVIRAGRQLTESTGVSVVWGHSQGGGAALFSAQLAPTYAPDVTLVGAVAGAPMAELATLLTAVRSTTSYSFLFQVAAGFKAAYPDLDLTRVFTPKGLAEVQVASRTCFTVVDDVRGKDQADYIKADPSTVASFARYLEDNTPGNVPTTVPIFVYHGQEDEQIPVGTSYALLQRACRRGGFTLLRTVYPGVSHVGAIATAEPDVQAWIVDRVAGKPAPSTPCPPNS